MHIFSSLVRIALAHKFMSALVLIVVVGGGYLAVKHFNTPVKQTMYVIGTVSRGTVESTVTGSGQVSASNQMDLQTKSAGTLVALNAAVGQQVKKGDLIGVVDPTDALNALQNAKLSYQQLITIDPTQLRNAQDAVTQAQTTQKSDYLTAHATLATASANMTSVMDGLTAQFVGGYIDPTNKFDRSATAVDLVDKAQTSYYAAQSQLKSFVSSYNSLSLDSSTSTIASELSSGYQVALSISQATKYTKDASAYLRDHDLTTSTNADSAYTAVTALLTEANTTVSQLLSAINGLSSDAQSLVNAQDSLATLQAGPTELDLNSSQQTLTQKKEAYNNSFVYAPFDGVIASVPVQKGSTVSSGATIATLITKEEIAKISLNEIDAAKVSVGQKVSLTFDAIDGLNIAGEVTQVDLLGTVSQGVVSYGVQIGFATDDPRVKPGMTVNATIITDLHQNVLTVSSTGVKTQGSNSYVQVVDPSVPQNEIGKTTGVALATSPQSTVVTVGLSDTTNTEIVSGLTEGQQYVARVIAPTTGTTPTTQAPSLFGGRGAVRTGGGNRTFGG